MKQAPTATKITQQSDHSNSVTAQLLSNSTYKLGDARLSQNTALWLDQALDAINRYEKDEAMRNRVDKRIF